MIILFNKLGQRPTIVAVFPLLTSHKLSQETYILLMKLFFCLNRN